jgi:hypothetical protein
MVDVDVGFQTPKLFGWYTYAEPTDFRTFLAYPSYAYGFTRPVRC